MIIQFIMHSGACIVNLIKMWKPLKWLQMGVYACDTRFISRDTLWSSLRLWCARLLKKKMSEKKILKKVDLDVETALNNTLYHNGFCYRC